MCDQPTSTHGRIADERHFQAEALEGKPELPERGDGKAAYVPRNTNHMLMACAQAPQPHYRVRHAERRETQCPQNHS